MLGKWVMRMGSGWNWVSIVVMVLCIDDVEPWALLPER
jgi:hypothetical protein